MEETKKPVILAVDDDPQVLTAVARDLRQHFGGEYRILRADSGQSALEVVKQIQQRNETIALFLVDQRMPGMSGVEFLEGAMEIFPEAKKALLTAYADTEAAIRAINSVRVDYYLVKPWSPPEEKLFPVLEDLLRYWKAPKDGMEDIRVVGHRWSPDSHRIKDFLARNLIPYSWVDVETKDADDATRRLIEAIDPDPARMPLILFRDGTCLENPPTGAIAEKVGITTETQEDFYNLLIIGGGPAGLAGAVYGASEGLKTLLLECTAPGGQAGTSSRIENYLGFPAGVKGEELAQRAWEQAVKFGVDMVRSLAVKVRTENNYHIVTLENGKEIRCLALLISTGVAYRKLDVPGLEEMTGKGVYYGAAMTEAMSCADEHVFIIGGANSAGQAAMYFSKYAGDVTMLVRAESLSKSMSQYLIDQIEATPNIHVETFTEIAGVEGDGRLERIVTRNNQTQETKTVTATGVFIFIGAEPNTDWLDGAVLRDERGFVLAGPDLVRDGKRVPEWPLDRDPYLLETSVPGIFVAGDVRHGSVKRVASGVGEGSIAISFIHQYLAKMQ